MSDFSAIGSARRIVRIFIGKISDLQQPDIRKTLDGSGELDDAEIVSRLEQKVDAEPRNIGYHLDPNVGKVACLLEGVGALMNLFCRVWGVCGLGYQLVQWGQITMRVRNQGNGADVLTFVGHLGGLRSKLRQECRRADQPKCRKATSA